MSVNTVLVIEDQPEARQMLLEHIRALFPEALVNHAADLASANALLASRFDVAFVDMRLPDGLGLDWIRRYRTAGGSAWVIVSTLYDDDDMVFAALQSGADGYVLKTDAAGLQRQVLQRLLTGEPPISPTIARKVLVHFRTSTMPEMPADAPPPPEAPEEEEDEAIALTPRETEVLTLIGRGLSIKLVAGELDLSYFTVNDYIKSIYRKLGIRTRASATAEAIRRGLLPEQ